MIGSIFQLTASVTALSNCQGLTVSEYKRSLFLPFPEVGEGVMDVK